MRKVGFFFQFQVKKKSDINSYQPKILSLYHSLLIYWLLSTLNDIIAHILTSWSRVSIDFHFAECEDPSWTGHSQSYILSLHTIGKIQIEGFAQTNSRNSTNPNRKCES